MLTMDKRLNICVLVNDNTVPQWIFKCIENLALSESANVSVIISPEPPLSAAKRKLSHSGSVLIRLFETIDRLLFRSNYYSHLDRDISSLKGTASVINLTDLTGLALRTGETEAISDLNPDVIVLLGRHKVEDSVLNIPKYCVWTFSIDKNEIHGVPAHGFREVIKHQPLTDMSLEIVAGDKSRNDIIYATREATYHYSITENRNKVFWRATVVIPRIIEGLCRYGDIYLQQMKERHKALTPVSGGTTNQGSFLTVLRDLGEHAGYLFCLGVYKIFHTDAFSWQLRTNIARHNNIRETDLSAFTTINPPRKLFWADPFVVADDKSYYVFVEEFIYKTNKAHLSVLVLDGNGRPVRSQKIIDRPYHMSYPFVFKTDGIYYMIPETNQNKTIELYRCVGFPYEWKFERNIMEDVSATDATLFHYENKWWLFTTIDQTGGVSSCSTELFLFYSDDPVHGDWVSHPLNPIVSDESRARCAGKFFIENGNIFRPSQDCSVRYGRGLNINHVTKLNEHEYNEVLVREIKPDWEHGLKGVHTLNTDEDIIIIDTYRFHRRISL